MKLFTCVVLACVALASHQVLASDSNSSAPSSSPGDTVKVLPTFETANNATTDKQVTNADSGNVSSDGSSEYEQYIWRIMSAPPTVMGVCLKSHTVTLDGYALENWIATFLSKVTLPENITVSIGHLIKPRDITRSTLGTIKFSLKPTLTSGSSVTVKQEAKSDSSVNSSRPDDLAIEMVRVMRLAVDKNILNDRYIQLRTGRGAYLASRPDEVKVEGEW